MVQRGHSHYLKLYIIKRKIILSGDAFAAFNGLTVCGNKQTHLPCKLYILASSSLLQNRFQAFNEIITILVVIEDIATPDSTGNDMVQGTGSINSGLAWCEYPASNELWLVKVYAMRMPRHSQRLKA